MNITLVSAAGDVVGYQIIAQAVPVLLVGGDAYLSAAYLDPEMAGIVVALEKCSGVPRERLYVHAASVRVLTILLDKPAEPS